MGLNVDKMAKEVDVFHDGSLMRKVVNKGDGKLPRPNLGDYVTITYTLTLSNSTVIDRDIKASFYIGGGEQLQVFDMAVVLMEKGETVILNSHPKWAYGTIGRTPDIPPNAHISLTVTLDKIEKDKLLRSPADILTESQRLRLAGNFKFNQGCYHVAAELYERSIYLLTGFEGDNVDQTNDGTALKIKSCTNLAAAELKIGNYSAVLTACHMALDLDADNVKALFRLGKAQAALGDRAAGITCITKALMRDPENQGIISELKRLTALNLASAQLERQMYAAMNPRFNTGTPEGDMEIKKTPHGEQKEQKQEPEQKKQEVNNDELEMDLLVKTRWWPRLGGWKAGAAVAISVGVIAYKLLK